MADPPDATLSRGEFFRGGDTSEYEIEVWACNWRAFTVYQSCQLTHVGMSGACLGLSAREIHAALELHGVPRSRWRDLSADLMVMGRAAAGWLNAEQKKAQ
ncbi:MAG: DUF1799 domain-containing protein [Xanthomonadales bacterium]|nr:DUF1799 domain-containing protein [Xanthomonadales bacterium]